MDLPVPLYQGERLRDLVYCYAGPWAFKPYLKNRDDEELLWHARQGVLLAFVEVVVSLLLLIVGLFPVLGLLVAIQFLLPMWLLWCLGMSVTSIVQATKGKRHKIPVLHQFVDYL
jgi:uncharacterized membrane protein